MRSDTAASTKSQKNIANVHIKEIHIKNPKVEVSCFARVEQCEGRRQTRKSLFREDI